MSSGLYDFITTAASLVQNTWDKSAPCKTTIKVDKHPKSTPKSLIIGQNKRETTHFSIFLYIWRFDNPAGRLTHWEICLILETMRESWQVCSTRAGWDISPFQVAPSILSRLTEVAPTICWYVFITVALISMRKRKTEVYSIDLQLSMLILLQNKEPLYTCNRIRRGDLFVVAFDKL